MYNFIKKRVKAKKIFYPAILMLLGLFLWQPVFASTEFWGGNFGGPYGSPYDCYQSEITENMASPLSSPSHGSYAPGSTITISGGSFQFSTPGDMYAVCGGANGSVSVTVWLLEAGICTSDFNSCVTFASNIQVSPATSISEPNWTHTVNNSAYSGTVPNWPAGSNYKARYLYELRFSQSFDRVAMTEHFDISGGGGGGCPAGQTDPHNSCSGGNCVSEAGCGSDSCTSNAQCGGGGTWSTWLDTSTCGGSGSTVTMHWGFPFGEPNPECSGSGCSVKLYRNGSQVRAQGGLYNGGLPEDAESPKTYINMANGTYRSKLFNSGGALKDESTDITASCAVPNYTLTVSKAGSGTGTVTSNPLGIDCGSDCSNDYSSGTVVTLSALADAGSTFASWSGSGCTGGQVTINTNRNCTATFNAVSQPDLVSQGLQVNGTLQAGQVLGFSGIVRNQGTASAGATSSTRLRVDIGNNGTWDVTPADQSTANLASSATETETWSNVWTAVAGTHRFEICVDVNGAVTESDEGNNCTIQTFTVAAGPQPDLIPQNLQVIGTLQVGQSLGFSGVVKNQGSASAGAASFTRLRVDVNNNGTWDVTPADQSTANLAVGATETETWPSAWTATAGTHKFEICADARSGVAEADEGNNCTTQTFTVNTLPDLITSGFLSVPANMTTGNAYSFSGQVRNQGGTNAGAFDARFCIDSFDFSDCYESAGGQLSQHSFASGLTANTTSGIVSSSSWTPPSAGSYTVYWCADIGLPGPPPGGVSESDDSATSNCASQMFTVSGVNNPPEARNLQTPIGTYCGIAPGQGAVFFQWTYYDQDGDAQSRFDFQVDNDSDFSSPSVNRATVGQATSQSVVVRQGGGAAGSDTLGFGVPAYYWRVRVYDSNSAVSAWTNGTSSFSTPPDPYPYPDFSWTPQFPNVSENISFDPNATQCYGTCDVYRWDFTNDGSPDKICNAGDPAPCPAATWDYGVAGTYPVSLGVSDTDGFGCAGSDATSYDIDVASVPSPDWREIRPFSWIGNFIAKIINTLTALL